MILVIKARKLDFDNALSILHLIKYMVYMTIGRPINGNITISSVCIVFRYLAQFHNKDIHNNVIGVK